MKAIKEMRIAALETGLRNHEMSLFNIFNVFLKDAFLDKACITFKTGYNSVSMNVNALLENIPVIRNIQA